MRLFFALDLPPDRKAAIATWRERYTAADARPVPPANFHITLAFLGELPQRMLGPLCDSVDARLDATPAQALPLCLDSVGYWPSPGIYWLGTRKDSSQLAELSRRLGYIGREFGARQNRRGFVPHVTLYRGCISPPGAPVSAPHFDLDLREITLFQSLQRRGGVAYEPLAVWSCN